jgi:hypothetical protein
MAVQLQVLVLGQGRWFWQQAAACQPLRRRQQQTSGAWWMLGC